MFQNWTDENIKTLRSFDTSNSYTASCVAPIGVNSISQINGANGTTGRALQYVHDIEQEHVLLTIEMRLSAFDSSKRYYPFVRTYVDAVPTSNLGISVDTAILPTFGSATGYAVTAKVLIPRLDVPAGQNQYVVVGYASDSASSEYTEISCSARVVDTDYRVFQPSK